MLSKGSLQDGERCEINPTDLGRVLSGNPGLQLSFSGVKNSATNVNVSQITHFLLRPWFAVQFL